MYSLLDTPVRPNIFIYIGNSRVFRSLKMQNPKNGFKANGTKLRLISRHYPGEQLAFNKIDNNLQFIHL